MIEYKINVSDQQKQKIKTAFNKQRPVRIRLTANELNKPGQYTLILNNDQKKLIDKSIRNKKGLVLELTPDQLNINHKGGFLPLLFAGIPAVSAAIGGIAAAASAYKDWKHKNEEEKEIN